MSTAAATAVLLVTLSTQGHWLAGREHAITLQWVREPVPAALHWQLTHGSVELGRGAVVLAGDDAGAAVRLITPDVRARTTIHWHYQLRSADDGGLLERGQRTINLHPDDILDNVPHHRDDPLAIVADEDDPLVAVLRDAQVEHERVDRIETLRLGPSHRVIVSAGALKGRMGEEAALRALVRRGGSVMVLEQQQIDELAGLRLRTRSATNGLRWRVDHPLLAGFESGELDGIADADGRLRVVELPADVPALELGYWPDEAGAATAGPVDALLVTRTLGRGRVVLVQLPLGPWDADPRSQRLLANALEYLAAPVGPTPSRAERHEARAHDRRILKSGVEP
ncbi:MAG: hypothetical protein WD009_05020 [Phycisphaeraceae bacterium]